MPKFSFIITLQNGEPIYNGPKHNLFYETKGLALQEADKTIDVIVDNQDCEDEDRFISGDFRCKIIEIAQ